MTIRKNQRGVVLLLTVLIMGTISISVLLGLTAGSINAIVDSHRQTDAFAVRQVVYGCLDEVFLQLVGDSAWSETSVVTNQATCDVAHVPSGSGTDILVTWSSEGIAWGVRANVTLSPLAINAIEETLGP